MYITYAKWNKMKWEEINVTVVTNEKKINAHIQKPSRWKSHKSKNTTIQEQNAENKCGKKMNKMRTWRNRKTKTNKIKSEREWEKNKSIFRTKPQSVRQKISAFNSIKFIRLKTLNTQIAFRFVTNANEWTRK